MSSTAPKIDEQPTQPLEKLSEALHNVGATTTEVASRTPLPEGEAVHEEPMAKAPGPVVARTMSFYNKLDMELVESKDFITDIERQIQDEQADLAAMVAAMTKISNARVKKLMERRTDALNEHNVVKETMDKLVGKA